MKGIAIAAAGAALLSTATASKGMHAHLHQKRDNTPSAWGEDYYGSYDPTTTVEPVKEEPKTPEPSTTWADWTTTPVVDPAKETPTAWADWTPTTPVVDPAKTSSTTWADWTTTKPVVDPAKTSSTTWADWTTTTPVVDPAKQSSTTWADWTTTTPVVDPAKESSTTWADWTTTKPVVDPAKESSTTWADWTKATTTTGVVEPVKSSSSWADWSASSKADPAKPSTTTWADWSASSSAVKPASTDSSSTWADWEATSTVTISGTVIKTLYVEPVSSTVTSTVSAGWSKDGWFGPQWSTNTADICTMNILTSYGAPIWKPTPDAAPSASAASSTWADWSASSSSTKDAASASSTKDAVAPTTTWADWSASASSTKDAVAPTLTTTWADWSSAPAAYAKPSGYAVSPAGFSPNGNQWGMTYSPYTNGGGCKDAGIVAKDLAVIAAKGFTTVRVYSTDCSTLKNVGDAARANGLKLILGVFISSTGIPGAQKQVTDIVAWAQWDLVELIVVGNEAVFNGYCSASALAGFISSSAGAFKGAGYTGKVTTTEPLTIWESQGTAFCGVVDVVAANLYAFFNAQTTADKAGSLIQAQVAILNGICSGKEAYIMESGWPSAGACNGAACPSPENQAVALKGIQSVVGAKVIFFSYENEGWKEPGQFGVEQHWGCADVFGGSKY